MLCEQRARVCEQEMVATKKKAGRKEKGEVGGGGLGASIDLYAQEVGV